ncbi:MAG: peptidase T [Deltaproteobacteria bacterium]|nr:peptidase T [Deltaproteobacteria bacterium]
MRNDVVERFCRYVKIDTQSREPENQEDYQRYPSTEKQKDLGRLLLKELHEMGLSAEMDDWGYVMGTLESNIDKDAPVIGLIAHVDTSPAASGANVVPVFHEDYNGGEIHYPKASWQVLSPEDSPELANKQGHTIITSDGTTLLGADNKAGVSEIMTTVKYLLEHPEIKHGKLRIGFTCDEEIGAGVNHFDIEKFGARCAYTVDGETVGWIENETFCADSAELEIRGVDIHPGFAKNRLVNSLVIASRFILMLPRDKSPETTDGMEGYVHAYTLNGGVDRAVIKMIVRDFTDDGLRAFEAMMDDNIEVLKKEFPKAEFKLTIREQYKNMKYYLESHPEVTEHALEAAKRAGLTPVLGSIRGGTDGSRLSAMGLPTPNIFTGGHNFHSTREWISTQDMEKTVETLIELAKLWAE